MTGSRRLGIIGGTGVYSPETLESVRDVRVETPYGEVFARIGECRALDGIREVVFLARHGETHSVPPHRVNYRANMWAMRSLGVARVIATAAVGSLREDLSPGEIVLVDQFLDFTRCRPSTFYEGGEVGVAHTDMTEPYCPHLRACIFAAGKTLGIRLRQGGTYVCTEGPRFETPAEVRMLARLGGDVVGMTGVPEVVLARELAMCYATLATVTNHAAGISRTPLTHSEVLHVMAENNARLRSLLSHVLATLPTERECGCSRLPEVFGASRSIMPGNHAGA